MPIYAYKCGSCGHSKDVLQKISDAPLTVCPACGAEAFSKQVTAAGFQLKGSGWYVTDFRGGSQAKSGDAKSDAGGGDAKPQTASEGKSEPKAEPKSDTKSSSDSSSSSTAPAAAPSVAAAPAAGK